MEVPGLVPRIEEQKERGALFVSVDEHGKGTRFVGFPVDRFLGFSVRAQPADVRNSIAREGLSVEEGLAAEDGGLAAQGEEAFHEFAQGDRLRRVVPWDPTEFVVLAIAIVVALLGAEALVAGKEEGDALRADQGGEEIPRLATAQLEDRGIVGDPFDAVVEGDVVRITVGVFLPVGEVVFLVVADEIVERESVVRGDEIHARRGSAAVVGKEILAAGDAGGELSRDPRIAPPETAHPVAEFSIQLGPVDREIADLVSAVAEVPRLGDQLHPREDGILMHRLEEGGATAVALGVPPEFDGEVETEAIDMHFLDPITEAVHHKP